MNAELQPILMIDGMNFLHRARAGFKAGDYPVIFNAFRNLRALVEKFTPSRIYFVLEGKPHKRYEALPEYKANRKIIVSDNSEIDEKSAAKIAELEKFFNQTNSIISLLKNNFPLSVVRHPDYECDDVIYNLIKRSSSAINWIVVSNDSDFTQLLDEFSNVKIYNPINKDFVNYESEYCYVTWKSLRGDSSDNIPGIPGVGDKFAEELSNDPDKLLDFLSDKTNAEIFTRNYNLIKFATWSEEEAMKMSSSNPTKNWSIVADHFKNWSFNSLLKNETWIKFCSTFDPLWGYDI